MKWFYVYSFVKGFTESVSNSCVLMYFNVFFLTGRRVTQKCVGGDGLGIAQQRSQRLWILRHRAEREGAGQKLVLNMLGLTALVGLLVALWTKAQLRKDTDQWRLLAYTGPLACSFSPSHCVCVCVCVFEALSVANMKCKWVSHFQSVNPSYSQFKSVM